MKKISNYCIVSANDADNLQDKVNDSISRGWQPLGGVCFHREDDGDEICWYFQQAIVIYED